MYTQDLCTFLYMCTSVKSKLHKQKYFLDKGRKMERRGGKKEGRKGGRKVEKNKTIINVKSKEFF